MSAVPYLAFIHAPRTSQCNVRFATKKSERREEIVQESSRGRYRSIDASGIDFYMYPGEKAMCACVPEVQFAGTFRDRRGTKPKREAWDSVGGEFATCSSANDLLCWFACKRLIRPFRAVEWMTISV
jgi:hypothetical protein